MLNDVKRGATERTVSSSSKAAESAATALGVAASPMPPPLSTPMYRHGTGATVTGVCTYIHNYRYPLGEATAASPMPPSPTTPPLSTYVYGHGPADKVARICTYIYRYRYTYLNYT